MRSRPHILKVLGKISLQLRAAWLVIRVQFLLGKPIADAVASLDASVCLPSKIATGSAAAATLRASRLLGRLPGVLDSCLVRSLVVAALLSDQDRVVLHFGFRPGRAGDSFHEGHAWVTVDGRPVIAQDKPGRDDGDYVPVKGISIVRGARDD